MKPEEEIRQRFKEFTLWCIEKKITVSCMESCTGGLIASLITDTAGASEIFSGSLVAYSNNVKAQFGVPAEVMDSYGVYSGETVEAMALAVEKQFGSAISIGISGSIGRKDPQNPDSVPGELWFALRYRNKNHRYRVNIGPAADRYEGKLFAAGEIIESLLTLVRENTGSAESEACEKLPERG